MLLNRKLILGVSQFALCLTMLGIFLAREMDATCTGGDPCKACKNCKYCMHCAKQGGTCGVCNRV